jgi:hypothetical protein
VQKLLAEISTLKSKVMYNRSYREETLEEELTVLRQELLSQRRTQDSLRLLHAELQDERDSLQASLEASQVKMHHLKAETVQLDAKRSLAEQSLNKFRKKGLKESKLVSSTLNYLQGELDTAKRTIGSRTEG